MNDLLEILGAMASKRGEVQDPQELFFDMAERVVKRVSAQFGTRTDEVAILMLTGDGQALRFVAPRKFFELGTIPITKRESIAVGVFTRRAGEAMNNVPMVRHLAFYESIKLRERAGPIQKMITVPIFDGEKSVGVAQISRKGESSAEAGADFTSADVRRAEEIFRGVGQFLMAARPPGF